MYIYICYIDTHTHTRKHIKSEIDSRLPNTPGDHVIVVVVVAVVVVVVAVVVGFFGPKVDEPIGGLGAGFAGSPAFYVLQCTYGNRRRATTTRPD